METEPERRDLGKEAEEEAAAAEAAQNAANCAAAANEASRIATEEANKSIAAAQKLAKEVLQATQIPTPATQTRHKLQPQLQLQKHQTQLGFYENYSSALQERYHPEASPQ